MVTEPGTLGKIVRRPPSAGLFGASVSITLSQQLINFQREAIREFLTEVGDHPLRERAPESGPILQASFQGLRQPFELTGAGSERGANHGERHGQPRIAETEAGEKHCHHSADKEQSLYTQDDAGPELRSVIGSVNQRIEELLGRSFVNGGSHGRK